MRELHRVIMIPDAVATELEGRPGAPGSGAPSLTWIERRSPAVEDVRRVVLEPPAVDPGEREAIALALGNGATVVMDDRRGRRRARSLGVSLTGTLGVLRALHCAGHARQRFAEDLDALNAAGMYHYARSQTPRDVPLSHRRSSTRGDVRSGGAVRT